MLTGALLMPLFCQVAHNTVSTNEELNARLARGPTEFALFQRMDAEWAWPPPLASWDQAPEWSKYSAEELARVSRENVKKNVTGALPSHSQINKFGLQYLEAASSSLQIAVDKTVGKEA